MATKIMDLIGTGFKSWSKNLAIILPFLFSSIASVIIFAAGILISFSILKISFSTLASLTDETAVTQLSQQISSALSNSSTLALLIIVAVVFILVTMLVNAYFSSGAIGMAKDYFRFKRRVGLKEMHENGKKFLGRFFSYQLVVSVVLLVFLGIFFILMVALNYSAVSIIIFAVMCLVALIAMIFVSMTPYIFIIEDSNLWKSFGKSFNTVKKNFWPLLGLFVLWALMSIVLSLITLIPVVGQILNPITSLVNTFIISPSSQFSYVLFCQERKL